jgi:hypothetical protein
VAFGMAASRRGFLVRINSVAASSKLMGAAALERLLEQFSA